MDSLEELFAQLKDQSERERKFAAEDLAESEDPRAVAHLIGALEDESPSVAEAARDSLTAIASSEVIECCCELLSSEHVAARNFAQEVLRDLTPDSIPYMTIYAQNSGRDEKIFVLTTLRESKVNLEAESTSFLKDCLSSDDENIVTTAIEVITEANSTDLAEEVYKKTGESEWVDFSVASALIKLNSSRAQDFFDYLKKENCSGPAYDLLDEYFKSCA